MPKMFGVALLCGSALALAVSVPLLLSGQTLPADRSPIYNPLNSEGIFDLLVHVDGEAILYIQGTEIRYQLLSGAPLRNAGSNYTQPVPRAVFGSFIAERKAGRGRVELMQEPSAGNDYTAVVRITDPRAGADFYHVRLNWEWNPADPSRPPRGRNSQSLASTRNDPGAYNRSRSGQLEFSARVDDEIILYVRADQIRSEVVSGRPLTGERYRFSQPLPQETLRELELVNVEGRGRVDLVEKPHIGNRYTAALRISDPQRGDGLYRFKLVWRR